MGSMHRVRRSAASLHVLQPVAASGIGLASLRRRPDPAASVDRAYADMGWRPAAEGQAAARHVVLRRHGRFVSLHDPAWLMPGDERLELAATLSRELRTSVIATALREADGFEFVLFQDGAQVDAAASLPRDKAWTSLRGRPQALLWRAAFGKVHIAAMAAAGATRLADPLAEFLARAGEASRLPASPAAASATPASCSSR